MAKNIVFMENKLTPSAYKMAVALKRTGKYHTTLVCLSELDQKLSRGVFDKIISLDFKIVPSFVGIYKLFKMFFKKDTYRFFRKLKNLKPYVVQVRGPSLECVFFLYLFRRSPRIFYLQDIWSYYSKKLSFKKNSGGMQFFNALSEKISIKISDGVLNRSGENSLSYKKPRIKVPVLDFLPFCITEWNIPLKRESSEKNQKKELHLVYAGTVWDEWEGHVSFPLMIDKIIAQGINLHLYPSNVLSQNLKNKLKKTSKENKFFHLHERADPDKINKEISNYDYALHLDFYDYSINPLWYITGMSAKIFGYMEAGLPIIINKDFKNMCSIIEKNKIGFGITYKDLDNLKEKIHSHKYPSAHDFLMVRKKYDIDLNLDKLEKFYDKVHFLCNKRIN